MYKINEYTDAQARTREQVASEQTCIIFLMLQKLRMATCYVKLRFNDGKIQVPFLIAKSRLAPIKLKKDSSL